MRASAQPLAVLAALLLGALLLSPLSANAATPGVNLAGVPGGVQLDQEAAAGGAGTCASLRSATRSPRATPTIGAIVAARRPAAWASSSSSSARPAPRRLRRSFADFAGEFAGRMAAAGGAAAYEVWNEPDEPQFWGGPVDVGHYTEIPCAPPRLASGAPTRGRRCCSAR